MMHYIRMKLYGALSGPTSELLGTFSFAVVLWYGGRRVLDGGLPAENLVMFVAAMLFLGCRSETGLVPLSDLPEGAPTPVIDEVPPDFFSSNAIPDQATS